MIEVVVTGLIVGLLVFAAFFIISLLALSMISGFVRLAVVFYRSLFFESSLTDRSQTTYAD